MGRQLKEVQVDFISLVKKGANRQPITIFKSDNYSNDQEEIIKGAQTNESRVDPKEDTRMVQFFNMVKKFFAGEKEEISKAKDIKTLVDYTSFNSMISGVRKRISDACHTLESVIYEIFWDDSIINGKELISQNIDEFKSYVMDVLNSNTSVQKEFFTKTKDQAGAKEVTNRVTKQIEAAKQTMESLKSNLDGLIETISKMEREIKTEVNSEYNSLGEVDKMTKEEMKGLLEPITKSLEALTQRVENLAKQEEELAKALETTREESKEVAKSVEEVAKTSVGAAEAAEETKDEVVKLLTGIQKSLDHINERVTTLEQFRGYSTQEGEPTRVEKREEDPEESFWRGIL